VLVRSFIAASAVALCAVPAAAGQGPHVSGFVLVALNPQPEPPGVTAVTESAQVHTVDRVALNPQPEPPGITDARRKLPPGPCRSVMVQVSAEGLSAPATGYATPTRVAGKCAYDVAVPGARAGATARVTFSRAR
jgi:hypothetical protein